MSEKDAVEVWKDVKGYEGHYQVSSFGRVKSLERNIKEKRWNSYRKVKEKILKQSTNSGGYKTTCLYYVEKQHI